jgi:hypothetical protein
VSGRKVVVKIDAENRHGGWSATNQTTGKQVRIKTAGRLTPMSGKSNNAAASDNDAEGHTEETPVTKPKRGKRVAQAEVASQAAVTDSDSEVQAEAVPATKPKRGKRAAQAEATDPADPAAGQKKLSALAAAAKVLVEVGQPMNSKQLIEAMAQKGYWSSPGGKTPEATLYAAIAREIKTKGEAARFTNPDRGLFAARA